MFTLKYRLQEEANPEGGEGGGGEAPKTYTQEELDAALKGLKDSRDALLTEKKQTAAKAKEAEEARLKAEQEAAKKMGELDKFEESLRGEFEKERSGMQQKIDSMLNEKLADTKNLIVSELSSEFIKQADARGLKDRIKMTYVDGSVRSEFIDFDGNLITTDINEFKKWLSNDETFSAQLKPTIASGGGADGNRDPSGGAKGSQQKFTNPVDAKRAELRANLDAKFK